MNLSDGVCVCLSIVSNRAFAKVDPEHWEKAFGGRCIIRIPGTHIKTQHIQSAKVLILGDKFEVIYTGLKSKIGNPQDLNKITFNRQFLEKVEKVDVAIPLALSSPTDLAEAKSRRMSSRMSRTTHAQHRLETQQP